jgi:PadR family transcriptional regulator, regulatory protein PadR
VSPERKPSSQTLVILRALAADPGSWRYGYDLVKQTGIQAGTLYPILMRLADRGQIESRWEPSSRPGRPPRHMYRLTAAGLALVPPTPTQSAAPLLSPKMRPQLGGSR